MMQPRALRRLAATLLAAGLLIALLPVGTLAHSPAASGARPQGPVVGGTGTTGPLDDEDETDPARNTPLPCEVLETLIPVGTPARTSMNMEHIANVCGIVGTDIEFQSRIDSEGNIRDYAFVGTMGAGFRIFDVTDPTSPIHAGGYIDSGWQNDIQVRGNIAVSTFDGVAGEDSTASTCLKNKPGSSGQGVDIFRLVFDAENAASPGPLSVPFTVNLLTCVANPPGGAHNSTLHPSGRWLAISNPSSDWAVDVIKLNLSGPGSPNAVHKYRLIDETREPLAGRCPTTGVTYTCIVMTRPQAPALGSNESSPPCNPSPCSSPSSAAGLFRPHDLHFSQDGETMYVAALNSTFIVKVKNVLKGQVKTISILPNLHVEPLELSNERNIQLSHAADVSPNGKILVIGDERGGGTSETGCNTDPEAGVLGAFHFWALGPMDHIRRSAPATPANPVKLGEWFSPNPTQTVLPDALDDALEAIGFPREERGCTVHQFRIGGNGSSSPGPAHPQYDGVSRIGPYRLAMGGYGMGMWVVDFGRRTLTTDDPTIPEDPRSRWGNTLAWNIQFGTDAWSGKEYKGYIYSGDMVRGFDVYRPDIPADPVVAILKDGPTSAAPGEIVRYRIAYQNLGPAASQNARIVDTLPAGVSFVSASDGATFDPATRQVRWALGTVPVGTDGRVTLRVRVRASVPENTVITNEASFRGDLTVSPPAGVHVLLVSERLGVSRVSIL